MSEFTLKTKEKIRCDLDGEPILKRKLRFAVLPQHLSVAIGDSVAVQRSTGQLGSDDR